MQKHYKFWPLILACVAILLVVVVFDLQNVSSYSSNNLFVASGHPEWAPIMWQKGDNIIGVGPELISTLAGDLKIDVKSVFTGTWDKVQEKARTGQVDVLVAAYKTAEREAYMDYSIPYTIDPVAVLVRKGFNPTYDKWEDLIGLKGILMNGDSYGQEFDNFIKDKLQTVRVASAGEALQMVIDKKADYFVYALYSAEKAVNQLKLNSQIRIEPKYVASENFYITISKKSPLVKYLPEINSLIEKYIQDGYIDSLITKYKAVSLVK